MEAIRLARGIGWEEDWGRVMGTDDFAVKIVFFDHNNVDCLGVLEGEEAKTTRPAGCAVAHNGAFHHLAEL
jgi:hypothetical protein